MKNISINRKSLYYCVTVLSVILFIIGLTIKEEWANSISYYIGLKNSNLDLIDQLIIIPFCAWAWLIMLGLFIKPKNWKIRLILIALLIPHILVSAVTYSYSGLFSVLKMYLSIFSFGFLK